MPLQTERLVMVGMGIRNDLPPVEAQPRLPDGIHLRWFFQREAGFPWHGYYLFRRTHENRGRCYVGKHFSEHETGSLAAPDWELPEGAFHSDADLVLTDQTGQPGLKGLDLKGRGHLRFDLPPGEPAYQVEVTVGFRHLPPQEHSIDVPFESLVPFRKRFHLEGVEFEVETRRFSTPVLRRRLPIAITITLPEPVNRVELDLTSIPGVWVKCETLDEKDRIKEREDFQLPARRPTSLEFSTLRAFRRLRIRSLFEQVVLHRIAYSQKPLSGRDVTVRAYCGDRAVASDTITHAPGQIATASLRFDRITSVLITPADGALVDLCCHPVSAGAGDDWQPVPGLRQPLTLPITHPGYPPRRGRPDLLADREEAKSRLFYPQPESWVEECFEALYGAMEALVVGGQPKFLERNMDCSSRYLKGIESRCIPAVELTRQTARLEIHPMDLVLLSSVHPAVAQMMGLYAVDTEARPRSWYDYLLVADHKGVGQNSAEEMLRHISERGFGELDAWIAFNKRMAPAPPLEAPQGAVVYALPGGKHRGEDGRLREAPGSAGLTWNIDRGRFGYLDPCRHALYHVWRECQGNERTPIPVEEARELVTEGRPLLPFCPPELAGLENGGTPDWPPITLHFIDFGLEKGWYCYQVSAVDLFGRFSPKSEFAAWQHWTAPPARSWSKPDSRSGSLLHSSSVRILGRRMPTP